jgi:hypothetical protein
MLTFSSSAADIYELELTHISFYNIACITWWSRGFRSKASGETTADELSDVDICSSHNKSTSADLSATETISETALYALTTRFVY